VLERKCVKSEEKLNIVEKMLAEKYTDGSERKQRL
jgi:hypothetical protein